MGDGNDSTIVEVMGGQVTGSLMGELQAPVVGAAEACEGWGLVMIVEVMTGQVTGSGSSSMTLKVL